MRSLTTFHVDAETGWGGGQVQLAGLCSYLRERGHRVIVVCRQDSRIAVWARNNDCDVANVGLKSSFDIGSVLKLSCLMASARPDVIHLHSARAHTLGAAAARMAGAKAVVATRHMQHRVRLAWPNSSAYGSWTGVIVAVSETVREALVKSGVCSDKIRVIHSGADVDAFAQASPADLRGELGISNSTPIVLTACSLVPGKGVEYLFDAVELLGARGVGVQVVVAGDGPLRVSLEERASAKRLRVVFLGHRDDMPSIMASADVFVMPSLSEGLGIAAVEAMAAGKPVVASRVGGLTETIVDGVTGLLFPPGDAAAMADAIDMLLSNPELAGRYGEAGRARAVANFSLTKMAKSNEALYYELVEEWHG